LPYPSGEHQGRFEAAAPWEEFGQAMSWLVGDCAQRMGEPGARIAIVQFGGDDEAINIGCPLTAAVGTRKQP
jgi:hypothetical protein